MWRLRVVKTGQVGVLQQMFMEGPVCAELRQVPDPVQQTLLEYWSLHLVYDVDACVVVARNPQG